MRKGTENQIGISEVCIFGCDESDVAIGYANALPALTVGSCEREIHLWMALDKEAELPPCIAAGAQDADRNFMHTECITLQSGSVNLMSCPLLLRLSRERLEPADDTVPGKS